MPRDGYRKFDLGLIQSLCDGKRTSVEIAQIVGCSPKYIQKQMAKHDLPRLSRGARIGSNHRDWVGGRHIDLDGYALVKAPEGHPYARAIGLIYEHRLVMERQLGRLLQPEEVVDHIDGLHLHNDPSNLRVFPDNATHLRETTSGQTPEWSQAGIVEQQVAPLRRKGRQRVDTYRTRKKRGDVRLRQVLLAWLRFDEASPHLLGTRHLLEQAQIDPSSRSSLERAWADLSSRLEADLLPSG